MQTLAEIKTLSKKGNVIPLVKEVLADMETPVSVYSKISAGSANSFLLESVEGGVPVGPAKLGLALVDVLDVADAATGAVGGGDAGNRLAPDLGDLGAQGIPASARRSRNHADEGFGIGGGAHRQQQRQCGKRNHKPFHEFPP